MHLFSVEQNILFENKLLQFYTWTLCAQKMATPENIYLNKIYKIFKHMREAIFL